MTGSTAGASSNGAGASSVPPLSFDRPAGGGSRSFDLPRSSDLLTWAARSDIAMRPSGGAARGAVFFAASNGAAGGAGSVERPGGRGGRGDMPSGWDSSSVSSNPQNPAEARPGGRGGRDGSLSSIDQPSSGSIERPGGRGGRDSSLSSIDQGGSTPSIDRPGGRGGRDGPSGGGGSGGGGSGGDSGGSSGGSGQEGGSGGGFGVGSVALYAGVIAAAWFGHKALFPEKQPEPVKPCCAGKGKKK